MQPHASTPSIASGRFRLRWPPVLPGLLLAAALAALAVNVAADPALRSNGIGALTLAILAGVAAGHLLRPDLLAASASGLQFARQTLLRLGVALYGLRLTLAEVQAAGWAGIATDLVIVTVTVLVAATLGPRLFGLGRRQSLLIGSGAAICGAAAVLATAPVVRGRSEEVGIAIATVVSFGTLAIFLYPVLHASVGPWLFGPDSDAVFGFYIGSTIHEVAQVIAAGEATSPAALDAAVVAKMLRVMMLAPFLMVLAVVLALRPEPGQPDEQPATSLGSLLWRSIPWFAVGFVLMVVLNSTGWLAEPVVSHSRTASDLLLATAMAALGTTIRAGALRAAGLRPLLLAGLLFGWLVVGGAFVNMLLMPGH